MQERLLRALLILIAWSCFIGGSVRNSQAQTDDHVITDIQGQVSVKRSRRGQFTPAYIGMFVANGDIFRLDRADSKARVTCSDGTPRPIERTSFVLLCGSVNRNNTKRVLPPRHNNRRVVTVRAGPGTDVYPVLVSPRMTTLLDPTPIIRWLPARDATSYKVSVFQGATEIWNTSVENVTQVQYPQDPKVALVPGKTYRVVISTNAHSSTEERMPNLGFALLIPNEAKKVREAEARIRDLHLSDVSTRLLVAELYSNWITPDGPDGKALIAEAIQKLEDSGEIKTPALARKLADLYLKIGLTSMAEDFYIRVLKLSQDGDIENQALVQHALGRIFARTRLNTEEALQRLQSAKALYQRLGDSAAVAELERDIQDLPK